MNSNNHNEKIEAIVPPSIGSMDPNTMGSAPVTATGGTGGSGGNGGAGGQAINITYVDNYSIVTLLSTFILMYIDSQENTKLSKDSLLLLTTMIEEQKQYRQEFLEIIRRLQ